MPLPIYLRKISFKDGDSISNYDFSTDSLKGKQKVFDFLLNINSKDKIDKVSDKSELNFDIGSENYIFKVSRELDQSGVFEGEKKINENFFNFLNSEYSSKLTPEIWQKFFIDHSKISDINALQKYISNLTNSIKQEKPAVDTSQIENELKNLKSNDQDSEKLERYREVGMRIKSLEKIIDNYQNGKKDRESKEKEVFQVESEVKIIQEKLSSVESLTDNIKEVQAKLGPNFSEQEFNQMQSFANQIRQHRNNNIQIAMKNARSKYSVNTAKDDSKDVELFEGRWFLFLAAAQALISIVFTIATFQFIHIFIGLLSSALILFSVLLFNLYRFHTAHDIEDIYEKPEPGKYSFESVVGNYDANENNLIVNVAMKKALVTELKELNDSIKQRLGENDYNSTLTELNSQRNQISKLKSEIRKLKGSNLSSEEYYKKRRELDILKIEKENIEYDNKNFANDNEVKIIELMLQIEELNNTTDDSVIPPIFFTNVSSDDVVEMTRNFLEEVQIIIL